MFGNLFDFNQDGKTDAFELGLAFSIMEDEENEDELEEEDEEASEELREQLEALNAELSDLQDELAALEAKEPEDICSDAHDRWDARRDLLEDQILDVEEAIDDVEGELDVI